RRPGLSPCAGARGCSWLAVRGSTWDWTRPGQRRPGRIATKGASGMAQSEQEQVPGAPPPGGEGNGWRKEYWSKNLRLMVVLLAIWFVVSFGCGILFV